MTVASPWLPAPHCPPWSGGGSSKVVAVAFSGIRWGAQAQQHSQKSIDQQSQDGTYSITSYLSISSATARAPATYSCHVSHMALAEPISVNCSCVSS
uniref:Ig-like domain-containing protein n=1 Tax=Athene cunicularia TaxID=194338 RepID=A0A663LTY5_ATHCN